MLSQKEYHDLLIRCRLDHSKFVDMQQSLSRKTIIDKLADELEIVLTFNATCARLPNFSYRDHVEIGVLSKDISTLELPTIYHWKSVEKFWRIKYVLHAQG